MLPTIITGLPDASKCVKEEIFGPVVVVVPFTSEQDVVAVSWRYICDGKD